MFRGAIPKEVGGKCGKLVSNTDRLQILVVPEYR